MKQKYALKYIQIHLQYMQYIHIWINASFYVVCIRMYFVKYIYHTYKIHFVCIKYIFARMDCICMYVSVSASMLPATNDVVTSFWLLLVLRRQLRWRDRHIPLQIKRFYLFSKHRHGSVVSGPNHGPSVDVVHWTARPRWRQPISVTVSDAPGKLEEGVPHTRVRLRRDMLRGIVPNYDIIVAQVPDGGPDHVPRVVAATLPRAAATLRLPGPIWRAPGQSRCGSDTANFEGEC